MCQSQYEGIVEIRGLAGPCQDAVNELLSEGWVLLDFTFINNKRPDGTYYLDIIYVLGRKEEEKE